MICQRRSPETPPAKMIKLPLLSSAPRVWRVLTPAVLVALSASFANAIPWAPKDSKTENEDTPEMWVENLPASEVLPLAPQARTVPALQEPDSTRGAAVGTWTFRGPSPIPNGQTTGGTFGDPSTQLPV